MTIPPSADVVVEGGTIYTMIKPLTIRASVWLARHQPKTKRLAGVLIVRPRTGRRILDRLINEGMIIR